MFLAGTCHVSSCNPLSHASWLLDSGPKCLVSGPWSLVPGPWSLVIVHYSWIFYGVTCLLWVAPQQTQQTFYWIGCSLTGCWEGFRPPPKRDILRLDAIIQTVWDLPCFEMEPHIPCKLAARLWSSAPAPRPLVPGPWYRPFQLDLLWCGMLPLGS